MIKAAIFDWGGVLIDNPTEGLMAHCANALNVDEGIFRKHYLVHESDFQRGVISESELWHKICTNLGIKDSLESHWYTAVKTVFKDKSRTYDLVKFLRSKGYKTAFLSNTEIPATKYFIENGYEKYFNVAVFSCCERHIKPEKEIYMIALKKLDVKPEEAIFIDDKPEFIEGAKKVGMSGIVYENHDQLIEELAKFSIIVS